MQLARMALIVAAARVVYDAEKSLQRAAAVLADGQVHATLAAASVLALSANLGAPTCRPCDVAATRL